MMAIRLNALATSSAVAVDLSRPRVSNGSVGLAGSSCGVFSGPEPPAPPTFSAPSSPASSPNLALGSWPRLLSYASAVGNSCVNDAMRTTATTATRRYTPFHSFITALPSEYRTLPPLCRRRSSAASSSYSAKISSWVIPVPSNSPVRGLKPRGTPALPALARPAACWRRRCRDLMPISAANPGSRLARGSEAVACCPADDIQMISRQSQQNR